MVRTNDSEFSLIGFDLNQFTKLPNESIVMNFNSSENASTLDRLPSIVGGENDRATDNGTPQKVGCRAYGIREANGNGEFAWSRGRDWAQSFGGRSSSRTPR